MQTGNSKWILKLVICAVLCLSPYSSSFSCQMWGLVVNRNSPSYNPSACETLILETVNSMVRLADNQPGWNGWSMTSWTQNDSIVVARSWTMPWDETDTTSAGAWWYNGETAAGALCDLAADPSTSALIHFRNASSGAATDPNPHPFVYKNLFGKSWTVQHNGTISGTSRRDWVNALEQEVIGLHFLQLDRFEDRAYTDQGELSRVVDSEYLGVAFIKNLMLAKTFGKPVTTAWEWTASSFAKADEQQGAALNYDSINLMISNGDTSWAAVSATNDTYNLYYRYFNSAGQSSWIVRNVQPGGLGDHWDKVAEDSRHAILELYPGVSPNRRPREFDPDVEIQLPREFQVAETVVSNPSIILLDDGGFLHGCWQPGEIALRYYNPLGLLEVQPIVISGPIRVPGTEVCLQRQNNGEITVSWWEEVVDGDLLYQVRAVDATNSEISLTHRYDLLIPSEGDSCTAVSACRFENGLELVTSVFQPPGYGIPYLKLILCEDGSIVASNELQLHDASNRVTLSAFGEDGFLVCWSEKNITTGFTRILQATGSVAEGDASIKTMGELNHYLTNVTVEELRIDPLNGNQVLVAAVAQSNGLSNLDLFLQQSDSDTTQVISRWQAASGQSTLCMDMEVSAADKFTLWTGNRDTIVEYAFDVQSDSLEEVSSDLFMVADSARTGMQSISVARQPSDDRWPERHFICWTSPGDSDPLQSAAYATLTPTIHSHSIWNLHALRSDDDQPGEDPEDPGEETLPERVHLHSAYPNPFNSHVSLLLDLPDAMPVSVKVYSVTGRKVHQFDDNNLGAGTHQLRLSFDTLASGVYVAIVRAGNKEERIKLVYLK